MNGAVAGLVSPDIKIWEPVGPGVHDIPEHVYHGDPVIGRPSLSSTGARRLLEPSCPALFHHQLTAQPEHKTEWDIGSAAHRLVLGVGPELEVIDADNWRKKATQEQAEEIRKRGAIPLLRHEHEMVSDMAAALRRHPIAGAMFNPDHGRPEQTLVWQDPRSGVMCRALLDWLPHVVAHRRLVIVDFKTAARGDRDGLSRAAGQFGWHQQAAWYLAGVKACGLDLDPAFVFVVQEKIPPYLVSVIQLDHVAMRLGEQRNRQAIDLFAHGLATGEWPGHTPDDQITEISLPRWVEIEQGADEQ